jgi:hypothetical protein
MKIFDRQLLTFQDEKTVLPGNLFFIQDEISFFSSPYQSLSFRQKHRPPGFLFETKPEAVALPESGGSFPS